MNEQKPTDDERGPSIADNPSNGRLGLPKTYCTNCKTNVEPIVAPTGRWMCPGCRQFVKKSDGARKHSVDVARIQQRLDELLIKFPPADILERSTCEQLAVQLEKHEMLKGKAEGAEWKRVMENIDFLETKLRDAKQRRSTPQHDTNLENLTFEQLKARINQLATHVSETEALTVEVERRQAEDRERSNHAAAAIPDEPVQIPVANGMDVAGKDEHRPENEPTPEQQAEIRRKLGWHRGVLNETTGWRPHE